MRGLPWMLLVGVAPSVAAQRVQGPPSTPQRTGWHTSVAPADSAAPLVPMPPGWPLTTRGITSPQAPST